MPEAISDKISSGDFSNIELLGIVKDEDVLSNEVDFLVQNNFGVNKLTANTLSAGSINLWQLDHSTNPSDPTRPFYYYLLSSTVFTKPTGSSVSSWQTTSSQTNLASIRGPGIQIRNLSGGVDIGLLRCGNLNNIEAKIYALTSNNGISSNSISSKNLLADALSNNYLTSNNLTASFLSANILSVYRYAEISDHFIVHGYTNLYGNTHVYNDLSVDQSAYVSGDLTVGGNEKIYNDLSIDKNVYIDGGLIINNGLTVDNRDLNGIDVRFGDGNVYAMDFHAQNITAYEHFWAQNDISAGRNISAANNISAVHDIYAENIYANNNISSDGLSVDHAYISTNLSLNNNDSEAGNSIEFYSDGNKAIQLHSRKEISSESAEVPLIPDDPSYTRTEISVTTTNSKALEFYSEDNKTFKIGTTHILSDIEDEYGNVMSPMGPDSYEIESTSLELSSNGEDQRGNNLYSNIILNTQNNKENNQYNNLASLTFITNGKNDRGNDIHSDIILNTQKYEDSNSNQGTFSSLFELASTNVQDNTHSSIILNTQHEPSATNSLQLASTDVQNNIHSNIILQTNIQSGYGGSASFKFNTGRSMQATGGTPGHTYQYTVFFDDIILNNDSYDSSLKFFNINNNNDQYKRDYVEFSYSDFICKQDVNLNKFIQNDKGISYSNSTGNNVSINYPDLIQLVNNNPNQTFIFATQEWVTSQISNFATKAKAYITDQISNQLATLKITDQK